MKHLPHTPPILHSTNAAALSADIAARAGGFVFRKEQPKGAWRGCGFARLTPSFPLSGRDGLKSAAARPCRPFPSAHFSQPRVEQNFGRKRVRLRIRNGHFYPFPVQSRPAKSKSWKTNNESF